MQPPTRGTEDPVLERLKAWAKRPTVDATLEVCSELRGRPDTRPQHVETLARAIAQRHAKEPRVMVALGRVQMAVGKLSDAQNSFVAAGKLDPKAPAPYRFLGEVLLRRGDAVRAEKMLERAQELEKGAPPGDELSVGWLDRARSFKTLQESAGEAAVAAAMAQPTQPNLAKAQQSPAPKLVPAVPVAAPTVDEDDDAPTQVGVIPEHLRHQLRPGFQTRFAGGEREFAGDKGQGDAVEHETTPAAPQKPKADPKTVQPALITKNATNQPVSAGQAPVPLAKPAFARPGASLGLNPAMPAAKGIPVRTPKPVGFPKPAPSSADHDVTTRPRVEAEPVPRAVPTSALSGALTPAASAGLITARNPTPVAKEAFPTTSPRLERSAGVTGEVAAVEEMDLITNELPALQLSARSAPTNPFGSGTGSSATRTESSLFQNAFGPNKSSTSTPGARSIPPPLPSSRPPAFEDFAAERAPREIAREQHDFGSPIGEPVVAATPWQAEQAASAWKPVSFGEPAPVPSFESSDSQLPNIATPAPGDLSPLPGPLPARTGAFDGPVKHGPLPVLQAETATFGAGKKPNLDAPVRATYNGSSSVASASTRGADPGLGEVWPVDRVLSSLQAAGVYTPAEAAGSPVRWDASAGKSKRRGGWMFIALAIVLASGIGGSIYGVAAVKEKHRVEAVTATARAEKDVKKGGLDALAYVEADLAKAFELDSRSELAARVWLQDRALRSHLWPGDSRKDGGLAAAIDRAQQIKIPEEDLAFARIALSLSSDDTPSAAALVKSLDASRVKSSAKDDGEKPNKIEAWRELAVGWVLERAGDVRSVDRYGKAVEIDSELIPARLALAKLSAIAGDVGRVGKLTADLPKDLEPTGEDLRALAALSQRTKDGETKRGSDSNLPRPAGFSWIAPAISASDSKAKAEDRKKDIARAFALARDPGDLVQIGRIASSLGDQALASKAALRALEASPIFVPARLLAARLALSVGRPDDAARPLEGLSGKDSGDPEVTLLRAWLAYEKGDTVGLLASLEELKDGAADRADLTQINGALRAYAKGQGRSTALDDEAKKQIDELRKSGDLGLSVAFDLAFDAGEVELAQSIAKDFGEIDGKPARALRIAKLSRILGKGDEADRASRLAIEQGTISPAALAERTLVLCALGKGADATALLTRYSLVAAEEQPWLRAYALSQSGQTADARKAVADLKEPDSKASWPVRRDALLALAALSDKRAKPMATELMGTRPRDLELAMIAKTLGIAVEPSGSPTTPPVGTPGRKGDKPPLVPGKPR